MNKKQNAIENFWSERAKIYKSDPRANTNDIWLRELEINYINNVILSNTFHSILDFGCANGYSTKILADLKKDIHFTGVDINSDMINIALMQLPNLKLDNLEFKLVDILNDDFNVKFDFIYTVRVFQNMESLEYQERVFDKLYNILNSNGLFLYIESYDEGYKKINEDRINLSLPPLPIHKHLTLLTSEFDEYVLNKMTLIKEDYLSSTYYLVTRLLYSKLAILNNEEIDYNHLIHQIASSLPQIGKYGPQKASLYIKK
jgi:SAM-dependent methyltransferase